VQEVRSYPRPGFVRVLGDVDQPVPRRRQDAKTVDATLAALLEVVGLELR
jgi:hypothetical protein